MAKSDLREWAVKGAEQRLVELADEARAIFAAFPELREQGRGFVYNGRSRPDRLSSVSAAEKECQPPPARRSASLRRSDGGSGGGRGVRVPRHRKDDWLNSSPLNEVTALCVIDSLPQS